MTKPHIMAVSVRSTGVAVAIFFGSALVTSRVSRSAAQGSYHHTKLTLAKWLSRYQPAVMIFEDFRTATRKGRRQHHALRYLPVAARRASSCRVVVVKRTQSYANKYLEAAALAKRFPALADRVPRPPKIWESEPHFISLFEAVALGIGVLDDVPNEFQADAPA